MDGMPTLTITASTEPRHRLRTSGDCAGFTLVEIGLVLLIITIAAAFTVPKLRNRSHAELVSHTRRLALTFRFLKNEAILNGRVYRLVYDLNRQRYWVESAAALDDATGFTRDTTILARGTALPDPVGFTDVFLPMTAGKIVEGLATTQFYPTGEIDPTVLHLGNGEEDYTLYVEPFMGRVSVTPGYYDVDYSA